MYKYLKLIYSKLNNSLPLTDKNLTQLCRSRTTAEIYKVRREIRGLASSVKIILQLNEGDFSKSTAPTNT